MDRSSIALVQPILTGDGPVVSVELVRYPTSRESDVISRAVLAAERDMGLVSWASVARTLAPCIGLDQNDAEQLTTIDVVNIIQVIHDSMAYIMEVDDE